MCVPGETRDISQNRLGDHLLRHRQGHLPTSGQLARILQQTLHIQIEQALLTTRLAQQKIDLLHPAMQTQRAPRKVGQERAMVEAIGTERAARFR